MSVKERIMTIQLMEKLQESVNRFDAAMDDDLNTADAMGALFEIPVICGLFARLGVLRHSQMVGARRYAIVIALVVAAVITPTGDPFTLMLVGVPIWMLYELGAWVVRAVEKKR